MMDPDRILRTLREAAIHLRATRGRRGTVIHLDDAEDVLVAGDLHGNLAQIKKILAIADLSSQPRRHLVLQEFVHGTERYPTGGCTSHRLLDIIAALKCQFPHRVHLLIGNHELAEWTGRTIGKDGESLNQLFAAGVETAYGERATEVTAAYHELIAAMPLAVRTSNRVFITHSIPSGKSLETFELETFTVPCVAEEKRGRGSSLYHLLWGRDVSEETSERFARMVDADLLVTGHIAFDGGFGVPNSRQVIVDCTASPAGCVLFHAQGPITHQQLVDSIVLLP
jgi:hypothetical protein